MLRVVLAASTALVLSGGCTVGPNFKAPNWASPVSWFSGPHEQVPPEHSVAVAAPVDPDWWNLFHDPELTALEGRVARQNLDVRTAATRLAESDSQLRVVQAAEFPTLNANASYTRQKSSDVGQFATIPDALGANGGQGNGVGGFRSGDLSPFDVYQLGLRRFLGTRSVRLCPTFGGIGQGLGAGIGRGGTGGVARHVGRGGAGLHLLARRAGAVAHRPRQRPHRPAKPEPDAAARGGRGDHGPGRGERVRAGKLHCGGDSRGCSSRKQRTSTR